MPHSSPTKQAATVGNYTHGTFSGSRSAAAASISPLRTSDLSRRRFGAIAMAVVGLLALNLRRSDYDNYIVMAIEAGLITVIIGLAKLMVTREEKQSAGAGGLRKVSMPAAACVLLAIVLPWLFDFIVRMFGYGNANEILMLGSLAWGALAAAVVARVSKTVGLSVICSGFLTLFTTFIADSAWATWFAYAWIALCLWWLVANHWERVERTDASSVQSMHRIGLGYLALGLLAFIAGTAIISGRVPVLSKLSGELMPTSGGTMWNDTMARSGIGNGDTLIAAKEHASSFGAVETDFFLDSEKPSLFDVQSDEFGEPRQKFRVERAQALSPEETRSQEGKFAETNRSSNGGEFSTDRKRPKLSKTPRDLASNALMFWEGEGGIRLAVERYTEFDGVVWRQLAGFDPNDRAANAANVPLPQKIEERTWFAPQYQRYHGNGEFQLYVDAVPEAIKFTRFRSPAIPTRIGTQLWSIDQITMPEFFAYRDDDCLHMPGRLHVPDYTVVRFINSHIDIECADELLSGPLPTRPPVPLAPSSAAAIAKLRDRYTAGHRQGWPQVAAIVSGVRRDFQLVRDAEFTADANGSLSKPNRHEGPHESQLNGEETNQPLTPLDMFLEQKRGPSYMFATTTAMLLESAGYKTRLVSGFYVNPQHYLSSDNEYAIQPSDAHVWLEVAVGPGGWIPLEPSPGYRQPRYQASMWYSLMQARGLIAKWSLIIVVTVILLVALRTVLLDVLCRMLAPLVELVPDRKRIVWLGRLLDLRLRWSGYSRPLSRVPRDHFRPLCERLPQSLSGHLQSFLDVSDSICFSGATELSQQQRSLVRQVWNELNCRRLRRAAAELHRTSVE